MEEEYVKSLISNNDKMVIILDVDFLFDKKIINEATKLV
jgi:chemotaxis signal transduction protein